MFIRLFRLVFNVRSPPEITRIQGSLTSESSNRESTPSTPPTPPLTPSTPSTPSTSSDAQRKISEAMEKHYKKHPFEKLWTDYKSGNMPETIGGQKSFEDTLIFFLENPFKCVISLHGNDVDKFLSTKFSESTEQDKKKIMKILFGDNDEIRYHQCSSTNDSTPIFIFYAQDRIGDLENKMKKGTYDKSILKYISSVEITSIIDKEGLEEKVQNYLRAITSKKLLNLSCTWKNVTDFETLMDNIVVKIMFGTVASTDETLNCGWSSEDGDIPIQLNE